MTRDNYKEVAARCPWCPGRRLFLQLAGVAGLSFDFPLWRVAERRSPREDPLRTVSGAPPARASAGWLKWSAKALTQQTA